MLAQVLRRANCIAVCLTHKDRRHHRCNDLTARKSNASIPGQRTSVELQSHCKLTTPHLRCLADLKRSVTSGTVQTVHSHANFRSHSSYRARSSAVKQQPSHVLTGDSNKRQQLLQPVTFQKYRNWKSVIFHDSMPDKHLQPRIGR
jgi:hypothetical protein